MIPLESTALPPLKFNVKQKQFSQKLRISSNKIGWVHTISDKPGATFDLTIKDAMGRIKMQKVGCHTDTDKFGELFNLPAQFGEELEVELSNIKNVEHIDLFVN